MWTALWSSVLTYKNRALKRYDVISMGIYSVQKVSHDWSETILSAAIWIEIRLVHTPPRQHLASPLFTQHSKKQARLFAFWSISNLDSFPWASLRPEQDLGQVTWHPSRFPIGISRKHPRYKQAPKGIRLPASGRRPTRSEIGRRDTKRLMDIRQADFSFGQCRGPKRELEALSSDSKRWKRERTIRWSFHNLTVLFTDPA